MLIIDKKTWNEQFFWHGIGVKENNEWKRNSLRFSSAVFENNRNFKFELGISASQIMNYCETINRWLPDKSRRILWIEQSSSTYPDFEELLLNARHGLGERRSIYDAPGNVFDAYQYKSIDQVSGSPIEIKEINLLCSFMAIVIMGGWDAWLVSEFSTNLIYISQGIVTFCSRSDEDLIRAQRMIQPYLS